MGVGSLLFCLNKVKWDFCGLCFGEGDLGGAKVKGFRVPALAAGKVMWDPAELWDIRIQLPGAVYMRKQAGSCSGQQGWRWHLGGVSSFPPPPALRQHRELWVDAAAPAQAQPFGCSPPSQAAAALSSSCRAFGLTAWRGAALSWPKFPLSKAES